MGAAAPPAEFLIQFDFDLRQGPPELDFWRGGWASSNPAASKKLGPLAMASFGRHKNHRATSKLDESLIPKRVFFLLCVFRPSRCLGVSLDG